MDKFQRVNPFQKKESHSEREVTLYKVLTLLSWLLAVVPSAYYTFKAPQDDKLARRTIWSQNHHYHTGFSLNSIITSVYFIVLFISQVGYVAHLFSKKPEFVTAAASVGSHFIFNNLFHFAFVMLFVRSHFWWAEFILIINFFNLSALYFRHPTTPRFIHVPAVAGPLAWTFVAIYWNGAIMVNAEGLVARIFANIAIWAIMFYGLFFLVAFKDFTMGYSLSVLSASLGVGQFLRQFVAFQWIFAFTIMSVLFVASTLVGLSIFRGEAVVVEEDRERAPLLNENTEN